MKNIKTIILFTITTLFYSCTKTLDSDIILSKSDTIIQNDEIKRITDIFKNRDLEININYHDNVVPYLGGNTKDEDFEIKIGNETFSTENGNIDIESKIFESYIGKNIEFSIKNDDREETYSMYVPKRLNVYESITTMGQTQRSNSTIEWEADKKNTTGVLVSYTLLDNPFGENPETIGGGSLTITDDGSFSISQLIQDKNIKAIDITLTRGNAVGFKFKGHMLAFYCVSSDSNMYVEIID